MVLEVDEVIDGMFAYIRASLQGAFERVKKSINGEAFDVVEFCQGSSVNRLVVIEFLGHEYDFMDDKNLVKPGEELILQLKKMHC